MNKMTIYRILTAFLIVSGITTLTACSENDDDYITVGKTQNRKDFLTHVKENIKYLAENLNFGSWQLLNELNQEFNNEVLNNPEFEKSVVTMFAQKVRESIRPVEAGSELAESGYKYVGTVDLTEFNYRFTQRLDLSGFDVEEADNFEIILQDDEWEPGKVHHIRLQLIAGGSKQELLSNTISNDTLAVVMLIPVSFEITMGADYDSDDYITELDGKFQNELQPVVGSRYASLTASQWTISGSIWTDTEGEDYQGELLDDATQVDFSINQNPDTHKSDVSLSFIHNDRRMLSLEATNTDLSGNPDLSVFNSGSSIFEVLGTILEGNSIDNLIFTLNEDLTTTLKVNDCAKALQLAIGSSAARRNYADEDIIDQYTQQLNEIVSGQLYCKGVDQTIPMQLQTVEFGVDYMTMPALRFSDEQGYIPMDQLLEPETIKYAINIIDHSVEPVAGAVIVVRQLTQYLQTLLLAFNTREQ